MIDSLNYDINDLQLKFDKYISDLKNHMITNLTKDFKGFLKIHETFN